MCEIQSVNNEYYTNDKLNKFQLSSQNKNITKNSINFGESNVERKRSVERVSSSSIQTKPTSATKNKINSSRISKSRLNTSQRKNNNLSSTQTQFNFNVNSRDQVVDFNQSKSSMQNVKVNNYQPDFINKNKDLNKVLHNNKKIEMNFENKLNSRLKK